MTMALLVWVVLACVLMSALTRSVLAEGSAPSDDVPGWVSAMARGASMLRPWLYAAPVCFIGAHYMMSQSSGAVASDPYAQAAAVLGMLPLLGALVTSAVGLMHVSSALSDDEDFGHTVVPFVPTVTAAVLVGVAVAALYQMSASIVLA